MGRSRSRSRAQSGASDARSSRAPSLTSSERAYMIRKAKEASVALVDHAHTLDGPVQWHYTGKFRGIQMYRGEGSYDRVGTAGTEFLCGVTTMMGTIEEVAAYFNQQTTDKMVAKKADDVLDCGVLYNLVQNEPQNPFYRVSAKYLLYEGPSAFSRERDYCFLECQNTFRHASGRRGWVLSMHSIKLPCCPEVDGVVRGSMYQSGYVFVEAEKDGYMDVMHSLQINFKSTSRLPHFLLNSALKRRILSVVTVSREIQSSRMGRQTLLKKKQLMPKRARALCVNCSRKFSLFVRKTRCRVCGEVVCQPCAPQVLISVSRGPPVKTRVCNKCYHLSPKDEYEPVGALPGQQMDPRRMQNETRYSDILQDHNDGVYHEADEDSLDEDEDEDGLEEQSDYSVFAQSRFTEASRDSVATTNRFDADDGASSIYSGTSTSYWQQESSVASSMVDWNQASSVQPADGFIYDPQASQMSSNFFGASNFTADEDYGKQTGNHYNSTAFDSTAFNSTAYNSTAPIPEDEPASHSGNGHDDSYASNTSSNKILSIQQIAKARSARYGINSQFPPPPPPPPLSPPPEEEDEEDEGGSVPLDAGVAPSEQMEDLTFSSQRSGGGYRISATPSKGSNSSLGDRRFDASQCSSIPYSEQADDLTFDASQLSLDQSKFSSSVAILETPDESARKSVAMMERNSAQRSSDDSTLFGDDLANRSTEDMTEHINSMRARNAYQLPDEDVRPSEDLQKREVEHRKRMEELARLTGNHVVEDDVRNRASSLGGLHDSAVSLTGFRNGGNSSPNQNHLDSSLMDSSMLDSSMLTSSTLGSSMVDTSLMDSTISTDEFDFESRPLGRTKRSGTIPFSLDEMHYTPAPVEEEPLSEPEDENVSEGVSEGLTDRASERLSQGLSERSSEASVGISEGFSERPSARLSQGLSERSSEAVSEGISECTSERASEGPSERPSERISERASGRLSEAISEGVSEGVSERSSDIASERSSERSRGLSAEESVAAVHSVSTDKFQPYSSQLVPGEGGAAVDEFFADESRVAPTSKLSQVDESDEEGSDSDRSHHKEENLEFMPSVDEHTPEESSPANPVKQPVTISTSSTEASERVSSPRESCVSDMSELDEDLMNRPTDLIYEQVRANRTRKWQPSASTAELHDSDRCSDIMYDIEESHRRRMEELNRIAVDHLGNRISNLDDELFDSSYRPGRALPSSVNENEVDDMQWRSTNDMDQYHSKHMQELDALRRKIRQLEEECRESLASVLTAEEMDLSEFDDETPADATDFSTSRVNDNSSQVPANAMGSSFVSADAMGSSFVSTNSLDMSSTQPMPPQLDEPVSARVLYEQIAQLTQLQREMAMAEDDADEEEYRARIKEQYRLLRTIKVHGRR
ncbi:hypothetical protein PHYBOEH_004820 [Phytophthora boehmeriae]|uniref:FYVE-type domain-containing protein n=1 Tax=Phytophthora boehmeriae TaxID=109152 RepID=A0A8T1WMR6_9STRA|nr:hypothetical protein PHYBOEH_004820 [Phytophthora boehmeriae]